MATLKDVAAEAGLALSTVSRILNNRGYISEEARKKVNDAVAKLNYHPNELACSLRRKNSNTIGLVVPHIRHPFFSGVIEAIEACAYEKGYRILLFNTNERSEKSREIVELCVSNRVAGIIVCTGGIPTKEFHDLGIPVIGLERSLEEKTSSIECDNYMGGCMAARLLLAKKCRHVLHLGDYMNQEAMPAQKRGAGFREVCEEADIEFRKVMFEKKDYARIDYQKTIESALRNYPQVDGIFCNSDVIAAEVLQVCRKLGKHVPRDIQVIGFDDVYLASLTTPKLTTIRQPVDEMARIVVNLLHEMSESEEEILQRRIILPVELIERESTKEV
ncbi:MAG: LacI family DNA-binding transcriptional regulator [Eubacterium sp.]|nr:LacI family DNA-binding transcriptional regulator [Eubacterium sp.]